MSIKFSRIVTGESIAEAMQLSIDMMEKEGILKPDTTFQEIADYAGSHVLIKGMFDN